MRTQLVVANWKLNGNWAFNEAMVGALTQGLNKEQLQPRDVVLCPPAVYLHKVSGLLGSSSFWLGAQDLSEQVCGAFTGEISGQMIKELGCRYVLVGHSERRQRHAEGDSLVGKKALAAIVAGLTPIICLGETLSVRQSGSMQGVIEGQLDSIYAVLKDDIFKAVIAYEPIWAIGTGLTATSEQAQEAHRILRKRLALIDSMYAQRVLIIYGGSVKASNAAELLSMSDIDGLLVGGASLVSEEFITICQAGLNL